MRRFEALRGQLESRDIRIVALSKDTVADAAKHKRRDGLTFTVLADPGLDVIRAYGVEHHKAVEFSKGGFTLFGIPLALVLEFKTMAIPTTLLVDGDGIVRWIDQADDYRLRSSEARVLQAVDAAFGSGSARPHAAH